MHWRHLALTAALGWAATWVGCDELGQTAPPRSDAPRQWTQAALQTTDWATPLPSPRWQARAGDVRVEVAARRAGPAATRVWARLLHDGQAQHQRLSTRLGDDDAPAVAACPDDDGEVAIVWMDRRTAQPAVGAALYRVDDQALRLTDPRRLPLRLRGPLTGPPAVAWPAHEHVVVVWTAQLGTSVHVAASWCSPDGTCAPPRTLATAPAAYHVVAAPTGDGSVVASWLAPDTSTGQPVLWIAHSAPDTPTEPAQAVAATLSCRNLPRILGVAPVGGDHVALHWACTTTEEHLLEHHAALVAPDGTVIATQRLPTPLTKLAAAVAHAWAPPPEQLGLR